MSDLISKSALLKCCRKVVEYDEAGYSVTFNAVSVEDIKNEPTVEAVPVVHGEWIEKSMDYICSQCKTVFDDDIEWIQGEHKLPNFCPECGADMRKKV